MNFFKKLLDRYAKFVSHRPFLVLVIVLILIVIAVFFTQYMNFKSSDFSDMVPDNYDVVKSFNILEDTFGSSSSIMIAIQVDKQYMNSNEVFDIKDIRVIEYEDIVGKYLYNLEYIENVNSAATTFRNLNNGILPKTQYEINKIINDNQQAFSSYINSDYTMSIINITLSQDYTSNDDQEIVNSLEMVVNNIDKSVGITSNVAGNIATYPIMIKEIGPDMQKTSMYSILGIVIVLIFIFIFGEIISVIKNKKDKKLVKAWDVLSSIRYGITPLTTILIGVVWTFGYLGLTRMGVSSITSGVISMIMGIGIDFGIQTVMRFRLELKENPNPEKAMYVTMMNVFIPMATTTIAALIGFKAMSMGELSLVKELGSMMSYGVTACFLAAITAVPALLVVFEKGFMNIKKKLIKREELLK